MARGVNKVILVGHVGKDPEVRYTTTGSAVVQFSLATNEPFRTDDGKWEERAEWHRVVAFERLAERCSQYLSKGMLVYVEGRIRTRQWEDQQGNKRYNTEIVAREIEFLQGLGQARQGESIVPGDSGQSATAKSLNAQLPPASGPPEDDIPF
jgi:single-strand DNA-binding protein